MKISQNLKTKNILIGITGGIAAYKTCYLIRHFKKKGHNVKVVISKNGLEFITETTLRTLSGEQVYSDTFGNVNEWSTEHISVTDWADLFIVAPATANIIGKLANGIADDALSTALIAYNKELIICPAMNDKMYFNPAVQRNIKNLKKQGVIFIEPGTGDLACGYKAKGRMAEPEDIFRESLFYLNRTDSLKGKKILVSAGRTEELIDPVRYISNFSSGKTGFRIAEAASCAGADTVLVTGPTAETCNSHIKRVNVQSAEDMYKAVSEEFKKADCVIMSAAVADYSPSMSVTKIKKSGDSFKLELKKTKDILKELGKLKRKGQILVGFALETDNGRKNALKKLKDKNLDMIILNETGRENPAFGSDTNRITIITQDKAEELPVMDKSEIAGIIIKKIEGLFKSSK
ncbi:MAG: bifunctional phosphopantothenoylcysteine decarboxylase/phosphopantothenate--cysteine ligase CoaBC [Candidatus Delongbacteria bacterium]|nr:bifunctional phosphopantothenoylcysteine decarboxylase/phosphopantothenate--cysteine ligase CoaBC [Candidatus Delongbacteria bacterium]